MVGRETKVLMVCLARPEFTTIRFAAYDYATYGVVEGKVIYVSADSLKEETNNGMDIFYRVHFTPSTFPVVSRQVSPYRLCQG